MRNCHGWRRRAGFLACDRCDPRVSAVAPEHLVASLALGLRQVLEALSVLTVLVALFRSLRLLLARRSLGATRLELGRGLSLALEFQLAADIVATTVNPSGQQLVQLAAIAVIRTFLNLFLAREIAEERSAPPLNSLP